MSTETGEDGFTKQEPHTHPADDWPWLLSFGLGVVTLGALAATALKKARDERLSAACAPSVEKDNTLPMSESCQGEDTMKEENTEAKETPYEFVDMTPFICGDKIIKNYKHYRSDDDKPIGILRDAFGVEWVVLKKDDGYSGCWFGIFKKDGRWHLLNGYFGSYEVSDFSEDPIKWLLDCVKNVRAFSEKEAAIKWLQETEEYSYRDIRDRLIIALLGYKETSESKETPDSTKTLDGSVA